MSDFEIPFSILIRSQWAHFETIILAFLEITGLNVFYFRFILWPSNRFLRECFLLQNISFVLLYLFCNTFNKNTQNQLLTICYHAEHLMYNALKHANLSEQMDIFSWFYCRLGTEWRKIQINFNLRLKRLIPYENSYRW